MAIEIERRRTEFILKPSFTNWMTVDINISASNRSFCESRHLSYSFGNGLLWPWIASLVMLLAISTKRWWWLWCAGHKSVKLCHNNHNCSQETEVSMPTVPNSTSTTTTTTTTTTSASTTGGSRSVWSKLFCFWCLLWGSCCRWIMEIWWTYD